MILLKSSLDFFRYRWFDFTLPLTLTLAIGIYIYKPENINLILWLSLGSLFLHQCEEWCYPGYFPGMINRCFFKSEIHDRYPLNANSGMIINVVVGWGGYLLAAIIGMNAIWLGIATILVSLGNVIAHTFIFNIKGKTLYNPGLITSLLFFMPIIYLFCEALIENDLASIKDWILGIALGLVLNYFGVYKMIEWLSDKNSPYIFIKRQLKFKS